MEYDDPSMEDPVDPTEAQLRELHALLLALRESLTELIAASKSGAQPVALDQSSVGRLSRMDAIQAQQIAKASRQSHELRLKLVVQALRKFERQEYGYCGGCEEPIGYPRLRARPEAAFCVRCQGATERA